MTPHTPGPWTYDPKRCNHDNIWHGNERIASVFGACDPLLDTKYEANARLIAAAPELLEALSKLAWHVEYDMGTYADSPYLIAANAAIAKATQSTTPSA